MRISDCSSDVCSSDLSNPPLDIGDLDADPLAQLQRWLTDAIAVPMQEPTAMTLASVDAHGRPSARVVLFKGFHGDGLDRGLTFYTNYESRKGRELADNPNVALGFLRSEWRRVGKEGGSTGS